MIGQLVHHCIYVCIYVFVDDVMPVLDIQNEMATCSSSESEIDAEYCLTVTMSTGRLNKHCHSGLARGRVHGAREVGCTVIQRANGSSSVITNQHSKSLATAGGWVCLTINKGRDKWEGKWEDKSTEKIAPSYGPL